MKKQLLILLVLCIGWMMPATACINPDTVVEIIVNYDTIWDDPCPYAQEIEIRLSNIRFMNESPNKICACALASTSNIFSVLHYVAFVDSGTNVPYNGFAEFQGNLASSNAWDASAPGYGGWTASLQM